jgi:DNA-binding HxlR family transcriptional regulator
MGDVAEAIAEFLRKKGAVELLMNLDSDEGTTFNELDELVHITRKPLSQRLEEAEELYLIEVSHDPADHGNAEPYVLTERGLRVRGLLEEIELEHQFKRIRAAEREIEEGIDFIKETFEQQISDEEVELKKSDFLE